MFAGLLDNYVGNAEGMNPLGTPQGRLGHDPGLYKPYLVTHKGRNIPCVDVFTGQHKFSTNLGRDVPVYRRVACEALTRRFGRSLPVWNATELRKEEWLELDRKILRAARFRLRFWADLAAANSYGGFNGMNKLVLEHETMSDPGEAIVDMSGITEGRNDAPQFQLQGLPLPITHADFWVDARKLSVSRNSGTPIDSSMGEASGRRVAESVEKVSVGVDTGLTYGGNSTQVGGYGRASSVYGLLNFPPRLTSLTGYKPTLLGSNGVKWSPQDTLNDILGCIDLLRLNKFYGPFMIYHSNDWDRYLDSDYFVTAGSGSVQGLSTATLRNRLRMIDGVQDVRRLDVLAATAITLNGSSGLPDPIQILTANPFTMVIVTMQEDTAQAVNGMDITTIQWETKGGMQLNFKVMCIQVPRLRADHYGNCGILQFQATR